MVIKSLKKSLTTHKIQSFVKIDFLHLLQLICDDNKLSDFFYLKLVIFDSKSYMKAKLIYNDPHWKLVLENKNQVEFLLIDDLITKIVTKFLKDIWKFHSNN